MTAARRNRWFAIACWLALGEVTAYFAATRLVTAGGTSGAILGDLVYPQAELLATVMLLWAGRRSSRSTRRFCWWMAVSTAMGSGGDITWAINVLVEHVPPSPSLGDAFYIASIAALFPALAARFGTPHRRWRQALDALMVVLLLVYVAALLVLRPEIHAGLSPAALVAIAETVLILLAGVWCILVVLTSEEPQPFGIRLIVAGIIVQVASWLVYAWAVTVSGIEDGSWTYTGWQASWALMVLGAAATIFGIERTRRRRPRSSFTWLGSAATTGVIMATVLETSSLWTYPVESLVALLGFALLLARLHLTLRERGRLATQMHTLAETDALTGVPNRRAFEERLEAIAEEVAHSRAPLGVLVIDVDHFKVVNDGYGHPFGDVVLVQVTRRLAACVRPSDMLARLGGEEFGVLAFGVTGDALPQLAERCRQAVAANPIEADGVSVPITISVGGACMPDHAVHQDELIRIADRALYEAKEAGRNRVHVGPSSAPQVEIPIPETGVLQSLKVLADRYGDMDCAIVDIAGRLCRELDVSVAERRRCLAAARLRDIGKIAVPPAILAKAGSLTPAEERIAQDHVRVGSELLAALPETRELAAIVAEHHERFDGRGYPHGAAGPAISVEARIIAVAEAWTHAGGHSLADAIDGVVRQAGHELDPSIVAAVVSLAERRLLQAPRRSDDLAA